MIQRSKASPVVTAKAYKVNLKRIQQDSTQSKSEKHWTCKIQTEKQGESAHNNYARQVCSHIQRIWAVPLHQRQQTPIATTNTKHKRTHHTRTTTFTYRHQRRPKKRTTQYKQTKTFNTEGTHGRQRRESQIHARMHA